MFPRIISVFLSLALVSCGTNVSLSTPVEKIPNGDKLSFLDISKFDRELSDALRASHEEVEVNFYDKVNPNNVPDRIQKWMSKVEADGGKILVKSPPNEPVTRNPVAALSLVSNLITSIKGLSKFNSERIYESAKGRDAVISLERNSKGEVVIKTIKFVKRAR
jgi:hypothetical protein